MGWWAAKENGRIDASKNRKRGSGLVNVVPGRDNAVKYPVCGDGPADILGEALNRVAECYWDSFQRPPTHEELLRCWRFTTNPVAEKTIAWDPPAKKYRSVEKKPPRRNS